ncbi:hypothetical protein SSX86_018186 [Deinandra increscens subsp. villosa]|uniref:WRKY domain-containing protein n=1 Tax=Deinandra increscens subsp. villosa TaxID=3103831 RepID=A0AAP0GTC4_9ASTR
MSSLSVMDKNDDVLIQTLIRGQDSTKRLQNLLRRKVTAVDGSTSVSADDLLVDILGSFSKGISMLNPPVSGEFPADQTPEVCARKKRAPAVKERRGCYKRRRTVDSSVIISGTIEDGYGWRKYGQKEIHNSTSPRCYYRCTHKTIHGCKALKQVQKLEDGSHKFHITYLGHHTCPTFSNHELVLDFEDFKNRHIVSKSPSVITTNNNTPSIKQELVDSKDQSAEVSDIFSSANNNDENSSSPADTLRWNEILRGDHEVASFMSRFDHEDSCVSTSSHDHYMYIDFLNNDDLPSGSFSLLDHVFP